MQPFLARWRKTLYGRAIRLKKALEKSFGIVFFNSQIFKNVFIEDTCSLCAMIGWRAKTLLALEGEQMEAYIRSLRCRAQLKN